MTPVPKTKVVVELCEEDVERTARMQRRFDRLRRRALLDVRLALSEKGEVYFSKQVRESLRSPTPNELLNMLTDVRAEVLRGLASSDELLSQYGSAFLALFDPHAIVIMEPDRLGLTCMRIVVYRRQFGGVGHGGMWRGPENPNPGERLFEIEGERQHVEPIFNLLMPEDCRDTYQTYQVRSSVARYYSRW